MFGKIGGALKERILKVQANIELRQARGAGFFMNDLKVMADGSTSKYGHLKLGTC